MTKFLSENWVSLITMLMTVFGGLFAILQWIKSSKLRRAEFLIQIVEKIRFDKEMEKANRLIEYNLRWYSRNFHNKDDNEYLVVRLLSYYSYICYLIMNRYITSREATMFEYELRRTLISPSVRAYLFNLYHFSQKRNSECVFQYLIDYGFDRKILPEKFKDKECTSFIHILEF